MKIGPIGKFKTMEEAKILGALRLQMERRDPEAVQNIVEIFRSMQKSCGLSMPLEWPVNSNDHPDSFLINGNVDVMRNTIISSDSIVGEYTYVGLNTHITKANIGRYCSIGNNVSIGPGEHRTNRVSTSACFMDDLYNTLTTGSCEIGHDVWIGADAIIRRGVRVGDGAVVGANSFVNADVPPYAIVAGSPAKLIKFRLDEASIETIVASRWWELDLSEARARVATLQRDLIE